MKEIYYRNLKDGRISKIDDFRAGALVYLKNPSEQELKDVAQNLKLEFGHLKDALDPHEVPRFEPEENAAYIFTRFPREDQGEIITVPILFVVSDKNLIVVSAQHFSNLDKFFNNQLDIFTTQKTKSLLQILSQVFSAYTGSVNSIGRRVRRASVELEKIHNRDIVQLVAFERILNDFLFTLVPSGTVLRNILAGKFMNFYEEDKDTMEDLMLSNEQSLELCRSNLKTIVNIRDGYSTIVTNNLNRVIKLFTSLTIILAVPTMIASLFGMNVRLPLETHPLAFLWILVGLFVISLFLLAVFIKNRWL